MQPPCMVVVLAALVVLGCVAADGGSPSALATNGTAVSQPTPHSRVVTGAGATLHNCVVWCGGVGWVGAVGSGWETGAQVEERPFAGCCCGDA